MIVTPKVNEIQEAAKDVWRYFRVFHFDSRMFKIVIRPKIDDRIEEVTALRQQLGHVSLCRKEAEGDKSKFVKKKEKNSRIS